MIIVKVPGINGLGKTNGARNAGNAILERMNLEERFEEIHLDNSDLPEQEFLIRKNAIRLFDEEDRVVFLGGDHSISFPLVDSFRKIKGGDVKLVVFDAHADCMPPMKEPTHEEWLRASVERGKFYGDNAVVVGLNKIEDEEILFIVNHGVGVITAYDIEMDIEITILKLREFCRGKDLYVSFDIDVFEKAKATGYPEGKMKEEKVMKLLDVVLEEGKLIGCDIVEINLDKKKGDVEETLRLARRVLEKLLECRSGKLVCDYCS